MTGIRVAATITATALSLFHDLDVIVMTLIWNLGARPFWSGSAAFSRGACSPGLRRPRLKQPPMAHTRHCAVSLDRWSRPSTTEHYIVSAAGAFCCSLLRKLVTPRCRLDRR